MTARRDVGYGSPRPPTAQIRHRRGLVGSASKIDASLDEGRKRFRRSTDRGGDGACRQRGWRFWRCWASSFTINPDGCMADLFSALDASGVQPMTEDSRPERYSERRVAEAKHADPAATNEKSAPVDSGGAPDSGIKVGDSIVVRFLDDNKNMSFVLSRDRHDPVNGLVGAETPFGKQLLGFNEEDEIEVEADGRTRRVLIVRAARERPSLHMGLQAADES